MYIAYIIPFLTFIIKPFKALSFRVLNNIDYIIKYISILVENNQNLKNALGSPYNLTEFLKNYSPLTLIFYGIYLMILVKVCKKFYKFLKKVYKYFCNIKENLIILLSKLPAAQRKLEKGKQDIKEAMKHIFPSNFKKIEFKDSSQSKHSILQKLQNISKKDEEKTLSGKLTGAVYCSDQDIQNFAGDAAKIFSYSNLLHSELYLGTKFLQTELINIGIDLFNGQVGDHCGLVTSGGTMSIIHAMWGYVSKGRRNGIKKPEIICGRSAHAAFIKAADLFNAKIVEVGLDENYKVNLKEVVRKINKNTVCIVGSCPGFPHAVMDDIEGLSDIALKYNVPLHVDCCLGGFLVCFYSGAGIDIPRFDFRLKGVCTISADLHKYGNCPKGISLLLFKNHDIRKEIYFIYPHWMGGLYLTPVIDGSRTGCIIAASYAVLTHLGKQYYRNVARRIHEAVMKVRKFITEKCSLLKVFGDPFICGVAFTGEKIDYFYDMLEKRHWHINYILNPTGCGFIFTSANMENDDLFIKDLGEIHQLILEGKLEKLSDLTKLYGTALPLPIEVSKESLEILGDSMLD